jgi:hypothetical protein
MERVAMTRLRRFAPYLLVGPVSGPLLARAVIHFRAGRPLLAGLYAVALIEYFVLLTVLTARVGLRAL